MTKKELKEVIQQMKRQIADLASMQQGIKSSEVGKYIDSLHKESGADLVPIKRDEIVGQP